MSVAVTFNPEFGTIESVLADRVTAEDLRTHETQCLALAKENETTRFFTDASAATLTMSVFDLHDLPQLYQDRGLQRPVRIAILPPSSERGRKLVDFYETTCANRGWAVKVFTERQEALDWLRRPDPLDSVQG